MNQRDQVSRLVKTDFVAALKVAQAISGIRERIQSLGWVARYAPPSEVLNVVSLAAESAGTSSDVYADTMALAWPLRALHETGNSDSIAQLLRSAVSMSEHVRPASSRAEALVLLIHAVIPGGLRTAEPAITALMSLALDAHWRVVRSLVDTALLANSLDRQIARDVANVIPVENKRNGTIERLTAGETIAPRPFFW